MASSACSECGMTRAEGYRGGMHRGSRVCAIRKMTNEMQAIGFAPLPLTHRPDMERLGIPYKNGPPEWYKGRASGRIFFVPDWAAVICDRYAGGGIMTHHGCYYCPFLSRKVFLSALRRAKELFTT